MNMKDYIGLDFQLINQRYRVVCRLLDSAFIRFLVLLEQVDPVFPLNRMVL